MADASPKTPKTPKTKIKPPSSHLATHEHENPSKFFLYKAALVTVFLVLVPFFPSLAPDFINQTLHARSWELLQLIFVGIAVSYGLFSKKNDDEPHKENIHSSSNNAQSYVSKLLQVSSVFDDESENQTLIEENKFQALNSQYYRGEAVVVKENPSVEEKINGVVSHQISQKPLLLPVRSLKQRVLSQNELDSSHESSSKRFSSNSTSSRKSSSRNGEVGGLIIVDQMEKKKLDIDDDDGDEKVVLRSPIPWRSRSGRLEMKENDEDVVVDRKKSFSSPPQASPPPPPPPPPPPSLRKSNSSVANNVASAEKVLRRSVRSVPTEELSHHHELIPKREDVLVKSVRTFRPNELSEIEEKKKEKEFVVETTDDDEEEEEEEEESDTGSEEYDHFEGSSSGIVEGGDDNVGRDVDKKADEFIAKFREQIRLQRIESIRRSTAQRAGKSLR